MRVRYHSRSIMRISLRWVAVALLALATPASAHPVPFSYLDLRLQPHEIDGTLVAHIYDVAHDLNVSPMERLLDPAIVSRVSDALTALMSQRLQVAADGRVLTPTWARAEALPDRQSVRIRITYPTTTAAGVVTVRARLFPYDPVHQTFLNVYEGDGLTQAILDAHRAEFEYFAGTRQGVFAVMKKFVPAGIHHILIGPD